MSVPTATRNTESLSTAVPILLPMDVALDEGAPVDLLKVAFPPDGCRPTPDFDWQDFATKIASLGGISVRRTNEYSDERVSVDFFGPDDSATRLAELVAKTRCMRAEEDTQYGADKDFSGNR